MTLSPGRARLGALALVVMVAPGCQSTQDKSAEIADSLGPVAQEKGLVINQPSRDVEVVGSTVLSAEGQSAVVVELRNNSDRALTDVPIRIDVRDTAGRSLYRNDFPGIEPALASVPLIQPGETVEWVHDQVLTPEPAKSVKVQVGESEGSQAAELPDIEVRPPELEKDPVSGINARGIAVNKTGETNERLLIYGVARRGGEIVAAGRAAIEQIKPDKPLVYRVYFVGDPAGAELSITSYPTLNPT